MLSGKVGKISWGYYAAADVHGYTVLRTKDTKQWSMTGVVGACNKFNLTQRPLVFIAPHQKGHWEWPIRSITVEHGVISAQLGEPQTVSTGTELTGRALGHH
jgi:hypothetical protein